jgi:hypothetical protein
MDAFTGLHEVGFGVSYSHVAALQSSSLLALSIFQFRKNSPSDHDVIKFPFILALIWNCGI